MQKHGSLAIFNIGPPHQLLDKYIFPAKNESDVSSTLEETVAMTDHISHTVLDNPVVTTPPTEGVQFDLELQEPHHAVEGSLMLMGRELLQISFLFNDSMSYIFSVKYRRGRRGLNMGDGPKYFFLKLSLLAITIVDRITES